MSYTMKQRNKIYKKALLALKEKHFLCSSLNDAIGSISIPRLRQKELFKLFPEFALFEPENLSYVWCFHDDNTASIDSDCNQLPRQIVFDFCILMTEN